MPVAQVVLFPNTDVFGDAAFSINLEPKAATGCHLNGRLVVSADFIHHRPFDVLELSFRGKLVMGTVVLSCAHVSSGKVRTSIGSRKGVEDVSLLVSACWKGNKREYLVADLDAAYSPDRCQKAGRLLKRCQHERAI
jgi:hypothetical protein